MSIFGSLLPVSDRNLMSALGIGTGIENTALS